MKFDFLAAWIKFNKNVDCRLGIPAQQKILSNKIPKISLYFLN